MNLSLTPQIRIIALVGLVLVATVGAASLMLGRSHGTPAAAPVRTHRAATVVHHAVSATKAKASPAVSAAKKATSKSAATKKAHAGATPARTAAKPATHKATAAKTTPRHAVAQRGNLVDASLPRPLQWQLSQHKIVVVSLYDPQSDVDSISVAEAHAGAVAAGAGFLLVNVLDNSVAGLLTGVLPGGGLLPDPGVLIYRAPGTVALRIDGFADRDTVAQAAANALAGETGPVVAATDASTSTPAG